MRLSTLHFQKLKHYQFLLFVLFQLLSIKTMGKHIVGANIICNIIWGFL